MTPPARVLWREVDLAILGTRRLSILTIGLRLFSHLDWAKGLRVNLGARSHEVS